MHDLIIFTLVIVRYFLHQPVFESRYVTSLINGFHTAYVSVYSSHNRLQPADLLLIRGGSKNSNDRRMHSRDASASRQNSHTKCTPKHFLRRSWEKFALLAEQAFPCQAGRKVGGDSVPDLTELKFLTFLHTKLLFRPQKRKRKKK